MTPSHSQAHTLFALKDGVLTAEQIAEQIRMSRTQVGENLRHLAAMGFVAGNTAKPRRWGMTGLALEWSRSSIGRSALEFNA